MRRILLGMMFFLAALVLVVGTTGCNKEKQKAEATEDTEKNELTKEQKEVRQVILQYAAAMKMQNFSKRDQVRRSLYANEYNYTGPDGRFYSLNQLLARQMQNRLRLLTVEVNNIQVRTYGQTAVANYQAKVVGNQRGLPNTSLTARVTSVLVKRDGKWQIVTDHLTPVAS